MPKKSSLKSTEPVEASKVEKQDKESSEVKEGATVIDVIFATRKRKKQEQQKSENGKRTKPEVQKGGNGNDNGTMNPKSVNGIKKKKKKSTEDEEGRFTDQPARHRKKTNNGLKIYTEEELGINNPNAGNTPDCPFDCDCCF